MIIVISFILDNIISSLLNHNSLLNPLFTVGTLILIYPKFKIKNNNYLVLSFIIGLIYDICITNTLLLNAFIFLQISYFYKLIFKKINYNYLSVLICFLLTIIYYRLVTYIILIFINYLNFNFYYLLKSIYSSILINIIYISLGYLFFKKIILKK